MPNFKEMGLDSRILQAIEGLGFIEPTPIQERTIPYILGSEKDLIALAQTGTGKTAAFGLPLIHNIDVSSNDTQALILCPTRELCMQISKDIANYSRFKTGLKTVAIYGGASIEGQIRSVKKGVQIIIGTPGRVIDLLNRKVIALESIKTLVLDEADEMLNMGFKESLDTILSSIPSNKQTLLFSATMPNEIRTIAKKYMNGPKEISIDKRNDSAINVIHNYYISKAHDKYETLKRIADLNPDVYGIVFCRTRMETKNIAERLITDGYNADALHGELSQIRRDEVMNRFRTKGVRILVATDVAARGLDVNDLTHVINYNLPDDLELYIHRSGRTGRAGKSGISVSIICRQDLHKVMLIEKSINKKFERKNIPSGNDIIAGRMNELIDRVNMADTTLPGLNAMIEAASNKLADISKEDLLKRFMALEFEKFIEYYKNSADLNVNTDKFERPAKKSPGKRGDKSMKKDKNIKFAVFMINIGENNNVSVRHVLKIINRHLPQKNVEIGDINIMKKKTVFQIDSRFTKVFKKSFKNAVYDNIPLDLQSMN
ncbi:MAG: DEAD/DEAH box helicase [Candidatus Kapaibacterium sp.]